MSGVAGGILPHGLHVNTATSVSIPRVRGREEMPKIERSTSTPPGVSVTDIFFPENRIVVIGEFHVLYNTKTVRFSFLVQKLQLYSSRQLSLHMTDSTVREPMHFAAPCVDLHEHLSTVLVSGGGADSSVFLCTLEVKYIYDLRPRA